MNYLTNAIHIILDYKYLSQEEIKGFDNYKYSSIDNSPLAVYVSHPFWNQVVKLYPKWLAPNVLTFGGMLLVMTAFALVSCYDYDLYASSATPLSEPVPNWVWLFCGICMFLAHVMDGTDGKQARRTGASGPTGELFDHGIDSWLTVPFTVTLFSIFGRSDFSVNVFRQMIVLMSVQIVFITTHWEKYNTGVLFLSWCYDASQYALVFFYIVTWSCGGYTLWKFYLPFTHISPANLVEGLFYVSCFGVSIPMSLYNIYCAHKAGTCKQANFYEALLPMFSVTALFASAIVWALASPTDVLGADPRMYFWFFGVVFSNIACRLIVAQMTSTRCQPINWLTVAYVCVAALSIALPLPARAELYILRCLAAVFTLAHVHYATCVIRQMCDHFNISCFSIKRIHHGQESAAAAPVPPDTVSLLTPDEEEL